MRPWPLLILAGLLLAACQPAHPSLEPLPLREAQLTKKPLDLPYETVQVTEVERRTPPDGIKWPSSIGIEGQTAWVWRHGSPVLMAATSGEWDETEGGEAPKRSPAQAYIWDWATDTMQTHPLDPDPSDKVKEPIPFPGDEQSPTKYAVVGVGGQSSIQAVRIGEGIPLSAPTIEGIWIYDSYGNLDVSIDMSVNAHELDPMSLVAPLEGHVCRSLVFRQRKGVWVNVPDKLIEMMAMPWAKVDLHSGAVQDLEEMLHSTEGAGIEGYLETKDWFFSDKNSVYSPTEGCLRLEYRPPQDSGSGPGKRLSFGSYVPAVHWRNSEVVFAGVRSEDDEEDAIYILAIQFKHEALPESDPAVIWESEVPPIFAVSTVVPVGPESRPYIVCLDPLDGSLTVFDPLLGSIRHQTSVDLAPWLPGRDLAAFCVSFEPDPDSPVFLIYDPNANEIIKFKIVAGSTVGAEGAAPP